MIRVLFCVFADAANVNAQSLNAREIALRLDPGRFASTFFHLSDPDPRLRGRVGIELVQLPPRLGSLAILAQLLHGSYDLVLFPPTDWSMSTYLTLERLGPKRIVYPLEGPIAYLKEAAPGGYASIIRTLRGSDPIVPISEFVARDLERAIGPRASAIIPVGVDPRFFSPPRSRQNGPVQVLFVGRLIKRKGADLVLRAAAQFPSAQFRIVGSAYDASDREFEQTLYGSVARQGLRNVTFLRKLSQEQMRDCYRSSDLLLLPSRVEGIPRATLEAAATGLPCIVFDDYETPSVVDGVTGFQVRTFEEMLDKLSLLIERNDLRAELGAAAVEHVRQFDWDRVAAMWESTLTSLCSESHDRTSRLPHQDSGALDEAAA